MKSYVADHNSVTSAIATAASKSYTVAKHQAQDCVFIEDTVEAAVAQHIGAGYEIAVNVKNYKTGDTSTTANIIIRKNDAVKATAVNVEIVNAWEFGLETLGAQVRADAGDGKGQGLRFGTKLDTANIPEGATVVEYGTVIGKAGSTPVVNGANMATVKAVNLFEEAANHVVYTAVVTNIPDKQMATKIVARPYVIYSVGETSYTYYGEAITRSIQEVIDASADGWDK